MDVHPDVNCGPETKILPMILRFIQDVQKNKAFIDDLKNAHLNLSKIDEAIGLFINHVLENENASKIKRPCGKDPDILYYMSK